jgi:hypothetical protein
MYYTYIQPNIYLASNICQFKQSLKFKFLRTTKTSATTKFNLLNLHATQYLHKIRDILVQITIKYIMIQTKSHNFLKSLTYLIHRVKTKSNRLEVENNLWGG